MSIYCYKKCILGRRTPERERYKDLENPEINKPCSTVLKGNIANKVQNKPNEEMLQDFEFKILLL